MAMTLATLTRRWKYSDKIIKTRQFQNMNHLYWQMLLLRDPRKNKNMEFLSICINATRLSVITPQLSGDSW